MAVHELLQRQRTWFCHNGIFKLLPTRDKHISVLGDCVEKWCFTGINNVRLMPYLLLVWPNDRESLSCRPHFVVCHNGIFKLLPTRDKHISVLGDCVEKWCFTGINNVRLMQYLLLVWPNDRESLSCRPHFVATYYEAFCLLTDECCLLPSQVMIPQLNPPSKIVAVASPALFYQALPIQVCVASSIKSTLVIWAHTVIPPI